MRFVSLEEVLRTFRASMAGALSAAWTAPLAASMFADAQSLRWLPG